MIREIISKKRLKRIKFTNKKFKSQYESEVC